MAYISVILVFISLLVTVLVPVIDLFLLAGFDKQFAAASKAQESIGTFLSTSYGKANIDTAAITNSMNEAQTLNAAKVFVGYDANNHFFDLVVGRVALIIVLALFNIASFVPSYIEDAIHTKKYGSVAKYEEFKRSILEQSADYARVA
ncbi:UNVERIFIED_CONTAM: hypothetical protein O8I53_10370 [Campylobacter lari]